MEKNTIFTIGQYMMQGFTAEEAPKAREFDILHNEWADNGELSEEKQQRYYALSKELGL